MKRILLTKKNFKVFVWPVGIMLYQSSSVNKELYNICPRCLYSLWAAKGLRSKPDFSELKKAGFVLLT